MSEHNIYINQFHSSIRNFLEDIGLADTSGVPARDYYVLTIEEQLPINLSIDDNGILTIHSTIKNISNQDNCHLFKFLLQRNDLSRKAPRFTTGLDGEDNVIIFHQEKLSELQREPLFRLIHDFFGEASNLLQRVGGDNSL